MTLVVLALVAVNILSLLINPTEQLTVQVCRPSMYNQDPLNPYYKVSRSSVVKIRTLHLIMGEGVWSNCHT